MSEGSTKSKNTIVDYAKAFGAMLGIPLALFGIITNFLEQPVFISVSVALVVLISLSVLVHRKKWLNFTEIILIYVVIVVLILAGYILIPKMTINVHFAKASNLPVVSLRSSDGISRQATPSTEGYYKFSDLPNGMYELEVEGTKISGGYIEGTDYA